MKKERVKKAPVAQAIWKCLKLNTDLFSFPSLFPLLPAQAAHWRFAFEKDSLILSRESKQKEILLLTLELH